MLVTAEHQAAKGMTPASLLRMASASAEDLAAYLDDAQVTGRCRETWRRYESCLYDVDVSDAHTTSV